MEKDELEQLQTIIRANNFKNLDLGNFIESKVRIDKFKHFDPDVGVDGIQFIGLPGSGKTFFAQLICKDLIKERKENILMSGDRFCEFRHFFRYPRIIKKITLILPDNQQLHKFGMPSLKDLNDEYNSKGLKFEIVKTSLDEFNINSYLRTIPRGEIFVIYDNHYQGKWLWKRAELWKNITKQLLERTVLLIDESITTLYNEAGILWQEGASGQHWKEINEYSEIVVECRKGLVRPIYLSQLETEIFHPIRKKALWKVYRLGTTSKLTPSSVRKTAPFQSRSAYILMYGGMFRIGNQTPKLSSLKDTWKIIPIGEPEIKESTNHNGHSDNTDRDWIIYNEYVIQKKTRDDLAQKYNVHPSRISQIKKEKENLLVN